MSPRAGLSAVVVAEAAADIGDRDGLDNVTLTAVASELGVRTPSLYSHVDGLDGLLDEIRANSLDMLETRITAAAIGVAGDEAVAAIAHTIRQFAHAHPGRYAATVRAPSDADDSSQEASTRIVNVVVAVLAGYGIENEDAIHATRFLRSAIHGFIALEAADGFGLPVDLDRSFEILVRQVVVSLNHWQARAADSPL